MSPRIKPLVYRRYIDDCFVVFRNEEQVPLFHKNLKSKYANINFTFECESNGSLPFLDISISHSSCGFSTSIYRKPTNTLLGTNFFSSIPLSHKIVGLRSRI